MKSSKNKTKSAVLLPKLPKSRINYHLSSKPQISRSIAEKSRIKNYIHLYSSSHPDNPMNNSTDRLEIDNKTEELGNTINTIKTTKINIKNITNSISGISNPGFNTLSLQRKCTELSYEIQKASSDKLELIRDIATYEYNFSKDHDIENKLFDINQWATNLLDKDSESDTCSIIDTIQSQYNNLILKEDDYSQTINEIECFGIRHQLYSKIKSKLLYSSIIISDIPCIVHINGTRWLEEMEISIITTSNLSFDYILKCNSSYIYHNKQELHKILHFILWYQIIIN